MSGVGRNINMDIPQECFVTLTISGRCAVIPLRKRRGDCLYVTIDVEDLPLIDGKKLRRDGKNYVIVTETVDGKTIHTGLHRMIVTAPEGQLVNHIDHNPLNNRRSNLRACTGSEAQRWRQLCPKMKRSDIQSKYKGVYYDRTAKRWKASIYYDKRPITLGRHRNEDEAARAYDEAAKLYYGDYALTNKMLGLLED